MEQMNAASAPTIKKLLDLAGSDKGKYYGGLYDVLLQPSRYTVRCLMEIGIGTLIPDAPSSMVGWASQQYRPGGSLRAWRDFFPNAEIYGLDVAADTQFSNEARIITYLCDSTKPLQAAGVLAQISSQPDLIIDDGLHEKDAQIATLRNFFPALRTGGLYVVEDVLPYVVQDVLDELERIHPGCHFFVDRSWEAWVAIVIRKPGEVSKGQAQLDAEIRAYEAQLAAVYASTSWKLTAPIRLLGRPFKRKH